MDNCNCKPKNYNFSMGCCQPVLGPIENYYTKYQVDQMLEEIESAITSGCCITPEEVDEKIEEAISGISPDLSDYYTKEEVDELIPEVPSLSGYATEQWVENQGYLTEHQHLKTINGQSLVGDGDIEIGTGGTIDLSNYYTTAETQSAITSAITVVEGDISAHTANTQVHVTTEEKNTWNSKANVWCGSEAEWSQISGSTSANTIYLVY